MILPRSKEYSQSISFIFSLCSRILFWQLPDASLAFILFSSICFKSKAFAGLMIFLIGRSAAHTSELQSQLHPQLSPFFFFNHTATNENFTPSPPRPSSNLPL